jgi:predicted Zn-dependent peptidase
MIKFEKEVLANGLTVLIHQDLTTPMAIVNTLYDVGAKDEVETKTGFAHLFEHLMFGGSANIASYDEPLQRAGGSSNAFTSNDITNYYDKLPSQNLETALWLESDRLLELAFTPKSLEVQRNVVIEEFKQRYINKPYGDVWKLIREMVYKTHPYKWPTIGKEISHIEDATMEDVKSFFYKHYNPQNAILCVAGNVGKSEVMDMVHKYYNDIPAREKYVRDIVNEAPQTEYRELEVERDVPVDIQYNIWRSPKRNDMDYYPVDLISDILGRGKSSILYRELVEKSELCTDVSCFVSGAHEDGMFIIGSNLKEGASFDEVNKRIEQIIYDELLNEFSERNLEKVKNKVKSARVFEELGLMEKALGLCMHELFGNAGHINNEMERYDLVSLEDIKEQAEKVFRKENECRLIYKAKKNG